MIVAGIETRQRILHDGRILAAETFLDELGQLGDVQVEYLCEQAERENILALVAARPAHGLDREAGNVHADMAIAFFPFRLRLDVVGVVKHDAAQLQRLDMVLVAVLVKTKQHVRLITRAQHLPGADAHLENGWAAGNRGRNRHERHDFLLAAAG